MSRKLQTRAHAKINLGLRILGRREDGFHDLLTVFQTVGLNDTVEVEIGVASGDGGGIALAVEAEAGCEAPADATNLAWRAAEAAQEAFGVRGGIAIRLHKRIPVGAGLGGGSSDAAAVIRLLARAARPEPPPAEQLRLAAALGSDVAPFLIGGTVAGLGRGDEVYALPDLPTWACVLAAPHGLAVATPEAFRRWDELTAKAGSDTIIEFCGWLSQLLPAFRLARNRGASRLAGIWAPKVQAGIENDLQPVVFSLSPDFPRIREQLRQGRAQAVGLSGSGAAQFGLFARPTVAAQVARRLAVRYRVWPTRFVDRRRSLAECEA